MVISIIGLLSSIVLASLNEAKKKANKAVLVQQFRQLQIAIEMYKLDNGGDVPIGWSGAQNLVSNLTGVDKIAPKYIATIPFSSIPGVVFGYISRSSMSPGGWEYGCGSSQIVSNYVLRIESNNPDYNFDGIFPHKYSVESGNALTGVWCLGD